MSKPAFITAPGNTLESMISPMNEAARQAAERIAAQHDAVAMTLVKDRLSNPKDFNLEDLRGRLESVEYKGRAYQDYFLDGKLLARFYPPEIEIVGGVMTVTQKYQAAA